MQIRGGVAQQAARRRSRWLVALLIVGGALLATGADPRAALGRPADHEVFTNRECFDAPPMIECVDSRVVVHVIERGDGWVHWTILQRFCRSVELAGKVQSQECLDERFIQNGDPFAPVTTVSRIRSVRNEGGYRCSATFALVYANGFRTTRGSLHCTPAAGT